MTQKLLPENNERQEFIARRIINNVNYATLILWFVLLVSSCTRFTVLTDPLVGTFGNLVDCFDKNRAIKNAELIDTIYETKFQKTFEAQMNTLPTIKQVMVKVNLGKRISKAILNSWFPLSLIFAFISFIITNIMLFRKSNNQPINWQKYFWLIGILALFYTFAIINATGGLFSSPFSAYYPIIISTVVTLFPKSKKPLIIISLLIIVLIAIHTILQIKTRIHQSIAQESSYYLAYAILLCVALIVTVYVDYQSRRTPN